MQLSLVILGGVETRMIICRMAEKLGFRQGERQNGLHAYRDEALELFVLDWDNPEMNCAVMDDHLELLKKEKKSVVLFCNKDDEQAYQEQISRRYSEAKWQLRPINVDELMCAVAAI